MSACHLNRRCNGTSVCVWTTNCYNRIFLKTFRSWWLRINTRCYCFSFCTNRRSSRILNEELSAPCIRWNHFRYRFCFFPPQPLKGNCCQQKIVLKTPNPMRGVRCAVMMLQGYSNNIFLCNEQMTRGTRCWAKLHLGWVSALSMFLLSTTN